MQRVDKEEKLVVYTFETAEFLCLLLLEGLANIQVLLIHCRCGPESNVFDPGWETDLIFFHSGFPT